MTENPIVISLTSNLQKSIYVVQVAIFCSFAGILHCRPTEKRSIYILVELRKKTFCDFCVFRSVSQKVSNFQKFFCGIIIYHAWLYNYTL